MNFRPLRKHKSGKVIVASYAQWRKVHNSREKVTIILDNYNPNSYVYNHELKQLFFPFESPQDVKVHFDWPENEVDFKVINDGTWTSWSCTGLDCDGVPAFTNYTADDVANSSGWSIRTDVFLDKFKPLTVQMVLNWLEVLLVEKDII